VADRVVVVGARRGNSRIPISNLKQMMGRAGRKHDGGVAQVDVIIEDTDAEYYEEGMKDDSGMDVLSTLNGLDDLTFHVLGEIVAGNIKDKATARQWFARSLRALQGGKFDPDDVFELLDELEAVSLYKDKITATPLGEVSVAFYFHPADVLMWKQNFTDLFEQGMENDEVAPAWALGSIPCARATGDMGNNRWVISDCLNKIPAGFQVMEGAMINTTLWWHLMGGPPVGKMKNVALSMRKDFGRIKNLLTVLDMKVARWGMGDFFDDLEVRVYKAIGPELLDLCKLRGITKGQAAFLYNMGVTNIYELREQAENIEGEVDERFMATISRLIR
jgi:hypothetical protein